MSVRWVKQPEDTSLCGQVAVAVIAGITLDEAIELVGHEGRTRTRDLAQALRKLGFDCPDRCARMKRPELAIAQVRDKWCPTRNWHWVVVHRDRIYDGDGGTPSGKVDWPKGVEITSYLPVKR